MVNVLFIGKYPPIQGGTATAAYWRQKELRCKGVNFEIITCIPADNDFFISSDMESENIHLICDKTPWHIPYSQLFSERLISKALEIAENQKFDVVEGNYLFPYGFAAYVVSKIINKPLILRHAGSDLYRVANKKMFLSLLKEMASHAKIIVTNRESENKWKTIYGDSNTVVSSRYVPNPNVFQKDGKHNQVAFVGKVTEKWDRSQLEYYYNYLCKRNYIGKIRVYSNDSTIEIFDEFFSSRRYEIEGYQFVMPEEIPGILRDIKYLLVSKIPSGIPEESNIYLEGISAGCILVCVDNKDFVQPDMDFMNYINTQYEIYKEAMT